MNTIAYKIIGLFSLVMAGSLMAKDSADSLPPFTPKVKTIAVFKNGLGFVTKSGETRLQNGWAQLDQLPTAALGTLWIGATSTNHPVAEVLAYKDKVIEMAPAINAAELLAANVGKRVKLTYALSDSSRTIEGTVLAVAQDRKPDEEALLSIPISSAASWRPPRDIKSGEIVLLNVLVDGQPRVLSLQKSAIQTLELAEEAQLQTRLEKDVARAKVRFGGNPSSAEIVLNYLEKGLVWSPSYRVNIGNEKTAEVNLEAIFANDVETLEDVEVNFVVGYPHFLYAEIPSPLSLQQSVASFIQSLATDRRSEQPGRFANVMSQSVAYNYVNPETTVRPDTAYTLSQPAPGEVSEDLYFYRKTGVTLKKGERARYTLLHAAVPYEHLYQWEIPDSSNVDDRGYRQDGRERKEPEHLVWHVLRLENTGPQPWTTAPAFAMNGSTPLAQDVLNYTPPKAKSLLKLTVATEIRAEQSQTEVSRKPMIIEHRNFDEVIVAGKLIVTNFKPKEVSMMVRKSIVGEVLRVDQDGAIAKVARKLTSVNPTSEIKWEFPLVAGATKEMTYQYKALVYR